jgi:hypothetical protein
MTLNAHQYSTHATCYFCVHSLVYHILQQLSHLTTRTVYGLFSPRKDIIDTSILPTVTQRSSPTAAPTFPLKTVVKKSKPKPEAAKIAARKPTVKQVVAAAETYNVPKVVVAKAVAVDTVKVADVAASSSDKDTAASSDSSSSTAAVEKDTSKVKV